MTELLKAQAVGLEPAVGLDTAQLRRELEDVRAKNEHLKIALQNSRLIGVAIGILVERHRLTPEAGFEVLVGVSQRTHRKLRDIASELVFSGEIPSDTKPSPTKPSPTQLE